MQFRTQRGNLLTVCERKTRFVLTAPLKTKTAAETGKAIINAPWYKVLRHLPQCARKTMTFDNGGEFARHQGLEEALNVETYFCDPHRPPGRVPRRGV